MLLTGVINKIKCDNGGGVNQIGHGNGGGGRDTDMKLYLLTATLLLELRRSFLLASFLHRASYEWLL